MGLRPYRSRSPRARGSCWITGPLLVCGLLRCFNRGITCPLPQQTFFQQPHLPVHGVHSTLEGDFTESGISVISVKTHLPLQRYSEFLVRKFHLCFQDQLTGLVDEQASELPPERVRVSEEGCGTSLCTRWLYLSFQLTPHGCAAH